MSGVLEGIRVIDFGQYIAGPMAAMLLGDQGADVIRIDPPGGVRWNTPGNATWNRNKRSIVLDLKKDSDLETARKLIVGADVLIENFRPGVMDRLGLGAAKMTAADTNARLVYCSLPGFGADDPRSQVRAWEGVVGAATCTYRPTSASGGKPVYTVIPFSSVSAAFLCAASVASALNARARSGLGQRVEIPLFDATFTVVGKLGLLVNGKPVPEQIFKWTRQLPCKDGRWLQYVALNKKFEAFIKSIGMDKWRDARLPPQELAQKFDEVMRTQTAKEWEDRIAEIGSEGAICHTSAEWLKHPQALASKIVADYDDPELGRFRGVGINVRLSATPGSVHAARPKLDANRTQILQDAARQLASQEETASDPKLSSALQGVKVLDLCLILAGPTAARTLAEFGADVIKIDSPHTPLVLRHNDINRAKRSILLDLKTKEGLDIFWKLVEQSDVVLQNFRGGVAEKLGIDYQSVRARKPNIIYGSINTFGHIGPYADRPGHEEIAQAVTGMQVRYGSSDKPAFAPFAANDYCTGVIVSYAVALALLHRNRTGEGQFVDSSLAYTASMLQSLLLQDYPGKKWDEPHGQASMGSGPLNRLYEAADGWLFLSARARDFIHCKDISDLAGRQGSDLEGELEKRIRQRPVMLWVDILNAAGIGAHRVVSNLVELMTDPLVQKRGLSVTRDHEGFGPITTTGPAVSLSATPVIVGRPAPRPGSDAISVLAEIGLGGELARLIRERVVVVDGVKAGC
jgi:crotonobetainyl-CoA:carnitine CoA-transferase CaiB-like acyl-CoA transferase